MRSSCSLPYFYPRPPRGGRRNTSYQRAMDDIFLSTPSARRATGSGFGRCFQNGDFYPRPPRGGRHNLGSSGYTTDLISIHALREEGDRWLHRAGNRLMKFLSTPSARRATYACPKPVKLSRYFYPRPPRGGRPRGVSPPHPRRRISIHALREEGDHQGHRQAHHYGISIHALREEGDSQDDGIQVAVDQFLSTPSARRATPRPWPWTRKLANFYPRPPRGGRLRSPRALRRDFHFYPRPPRGGRHRRREDRLRSRVISIHALREEGDRLRAAGIDAVDQFLSTPSARRATRRHRDFLWLCGISIHALREEGDSRESGNEGVSMDFYPRPPRGGRQQKQRQNLYFQTNYTTFCTNLEEP